MKKKRIVILRESIGMRRKGVNGKAALLTCLTSKNKQILQGARSEKRLLQEGTIGAM